MSEFDDLNGFFIHELIDGDTTIVVGSGSTCKRIFHVHTTERMEASAIMSLSGLPQFYTKHPTFAWLIMNGMNVNQFTDAYNWKVSCNYIMVKSDNSGNTPWGQPAQIRLGWKNYEYVARTCYAFKDMKGTAWLGQDPKGRIPITNSHQDAFDPPPMVPLRNKVISISKNESISEEALNTKLELIGTINKGKEVVTGFKLEPMQGLIRNISFDRAYFQGTPYFTMQYEVEIDESNHTLKIMDDGFYYKESDAKPNVPFKDTHDNAFVTPGKLDGHGGRLATGDPYFFEFLTLSFTDWKPLDLPKSMYEKR